MSIDEIVCHSAKRPHQVPDFVVWLSIGNRSDVRGIRAMP